MSKSFTAHATPTLDELAAKKLIDDLLESDSEYLMRDIASMDQHEQLLLSPYVWKELKRLHDLDKERKSLGERYFPDADRNLFTNSGSRIPPRARPTDPEGKVNGHVLRNRFLAEWAYSPRDYEGDNYYKYDPRQPKAQCQWSTSHCDLHRKDNKSAFQVCHCVKKDYFLCKTHPFSERIKILTNCISSPLLFYRLTAVFGMPPAVETDRYKVCWTAKLRRIGDEESCLNLSEVKGGALVKFEGSSEASESALKLLDWLVSDNIPHTYDGILAGDIA